MAKNVKQCSLVIFEPLHSMELPSVMALSQLFRFLNVDAVDERAGPISFASESPPTYYLIA